MYSNKKYGLKIDDRLVEIYARYLGTGSPDAKIWFIGLEEKLRAGESPLDKIITDRLNCCCNNKFSLNDFFTKDFSFTQSTEKLWEGYETMSSLSGKPQTSLFIVEQFFLPIGSGNSLFSSYRGIRERYRTDYYLANRLDILLEKRINTLCSLIAAAKKKLIIFYGNDKERTRLINDAFIRNGISSKPVFTERGRVSDKSKIQCFNYNGNDIYLVDFITLNSFHNLQETELMGKMNFFSHANYGKDLFTGLSVEGLDIGEKCTQEDCDGDILEKAQDGGDSFVRYCNKCQTVTN